VSGPVCGLESSSLTLGWGGGGLLGCSPCFSPLTGCRVAQGGGDTHDVFFLSLQVELVLEELERVWSVRAGPRGGGLGALAPPEESWGAALAVVCVFVLQEEPEGVR